jgi:hypothetical protein
VLCHAAIIAIIAIIAVIAVIAVIAARPWLIDLDRG